MKKILVMLIMLMAVPALAAPTISFANAEVNGYFNYNADESVSLFTFYPTVDVTHGLDSDPTDLLAAGFAYVVLPDLKVTSSTTVDPSTGFQIIDPVFGMGLTGDLGPGVLSDGGDGILLYSAILNNITVNSAAFSPALTAIQAYLVSGGTTLEFDLVLNAGSGVDILSDGVEGGDVSGTIAIPTVPVPGAFLLGGIGVSLVGWMKRRRSF